MEEDFWPAKIKRYYTDHDGTPVPIVSWFHVPEYWGSAKEWTTWDAQPRPPTDKGRFQEWLQACQAAEMALSQEPPQLHTITIDLPGGASGDVQAPLSSSTPQKPSDAFAVDDEDMFKGKEPQQGNLNKHFV